MYPRNHHKPTKLLLLTQCCPSSLAVEVPGSSATFCCTPFWIHPQLWSCVELYAGCAQLAPHPTLGMDVLAGPRSDLSLKPLAHYPECTLAIRFLRSTEQCVFVVPFANTA